MRTRYNFIFILLTITFMYSCDKVADERDEYLVNNFHSISITDWDNVITDSVEVELWYDGENDINAYLSQPRSVIELAEDKFWVSDVMYGSIIEFDDQAQFIKKVATRGKGPREIIRPYAMVKDKNFTNTHIYVLDGEQQQLIKFNRLGNEISRKVSSSVDFKSMIDKPYVIDDNSILWFNSSNRDFVVSEWDSSGNFKKGWINRIIPLGSQPSALNDVVYDIDESTNEIVYSFKGLPFIFVENEENGKTLVRLEEDITLDKEIEKIKESTGEFNGVNTIIKGISSRNGTIYLGKDNSLWQLPFDKSKAIKKYKLWNQGESIIYHFMLETDNFLFFIDGFNNKIYRRALK